MNMNRSRPPRTTGSLSRRKLIVGGLATAAGASGLGAAIRLASQYGLRSHPTTAASTAWARR